VLVLVLSWCWCSPGALLVLALVLSWCWCSPGAGADESWILYQRILDAAADLWDL